MAETVPEAEWIWCDGERVRWEDARIHVVSHVVHYGSSVIEGLRSYETPEGTAVFRLAAHLRRFYDSCRIYRMEPRPSPDEVARACHDILRWNDLRGDAYIRPVALRGVGAAGLDPQSSPVRTYVLAWSWGAYLGPHTVERGVDVCVSSWTRPASNTHPAMAKAGGNYLSSQLMKMEAVSRGFQEAIGLSTDGTVSEASGQNLFLVREGELVTAPLAATILAGVTRDSVLRIAEDLGVPVRETRIPRELLYLADEIFLCGTASEIVPVRSVDGVQVGGGSAGPVTRRVQERFFGITRGELEDTRGWLEYPAATAVGAAR